jgi:hypothetical protein
MKEKEIIKNIKISVDRKIENQKRIIDMVEYKGFSLACLYEKLQVLQEVKDMIYEIEHGWND